MLLEEYKEHHQDMMDSWYKKRQMEPLPFEYLPAVGFIIPDICAGFLYQTDGAMGLIENYITNPDANSVNRDKALDLVTESLVNKAKQLKLKYIISTTNQKNILKRSRKFGYKDLGLYNVIYKEL